MRGGSWVGRIQDITNNVTIYEFTSELYSTTANDRTTNTMFAGPIIFTPTGGNAEIRLDVQLSNHTTGTLGRTTGSAETPNNAWLTAMQINAISDRDWETSY